MTKIQFTERDQVLMEWERQLEVEFEQWGNAFIAWARACGAMISDDGIDYRLSLDRLQVSLAAMASTQGAARHQRLLDKFRDFSVRCGGYLASQASDGHALWLSKPGSAWTSQDIKGR